MTWWAHVTLWPSPAGRAGCTMEWVSCTWVWMVLLQSSPFYPFILDIVAIVALSLQNVNSCTSKSLSVPSGHPAARGSEWLCSGIGLILRELKTQGYSAWCHQEVRRNYVTSQQSWYFLPSGQGTDTTSLPLQPSLSNQNPQSLFLMAAETSSEPALNNLSHN